MPETKPVEVVTDHRCVLGHLTDALAASASRGDRGDALAGQAYAALLALDHRQFGQCCLPAYIELAPERLDREIQVPIAHAEAAQLDTRVLLWPVGAKDGQHPHCDGWAAVMVAQGTLTTSEQRGERRLPERVMELRAPELIRPVQDVSHHIHNAGEQVGLTIHVFGT